MKKTAVVLAIVVFSGIFMPPVFAEVGFRADLLSRYTWRGFDLNPYGEPVLQPAAIFTLGKTGFALVPWASLSFKNHEVDEFRLTLSFRRMIFPQVALEAGVIHYGWYFVPEFRFKEDTSQEAYVSLSLDRLFFRPEIAVFYDFTNGDGVYILLRTSVSVQPLNLLRAEIAASLGYNGGQWLAEGEKSGLSDLNFEMTFPLKIGGLRIAPFVGYTRILLDALGRSGHFRVGLSAAWGAAEERRFR